jgi:hypothetical protein
MKGIKKDLSLYADILSIKMSVNGQKDVGNLSELDLSYSVRAAISSFNESEKVHALAIIKQILVRHPEYDNYLAEKLSFDNLTIQGDRKTTSDWLNDLRKVYDPSIKLLDGKSYLGFMSARSTPWKILHKLRF